jgi:hypothetical protein
LTTKATNTLKELPRQIGMGGRKGGRKGDDELPVFFVCPVAMDGRADAQDGREEGDVTREVAAQVRTALLAGLK